MSLHLFHPMLVHFTIASVLLGAAGEIWGLLRRRQGAAEWGARLLLVGLASLTLTIASGYLALNTTVLPEAARRALARHELLAWVLLGLLGASQFWKAWGGGRLPAGQHKAYAVLLALAAGVTVYCALLGAQMVYDHGVGVAGTSP